MLPARDEVDALLVQRIRAQDGVKIQDESDLGTGAQGYGTLAAGTAPGDTDRDGMPDSWERRRVLHAPHTLVAAICSLRTRHDR